MENHHKNIAIEIMNLEQTIEDEVNDNGSPLTNEELDSLYAELQKLQMLRIKKS